MAEINSQFFDGKTYFAKDFSESFKNTMRNGILADDSFCKTSVVENMQISVSAGRGWINGHSFQIENSLTFDLANADGSLNRVDSVVIRLNTSVGNEKIECIVVTGDPGELTYEPVRNGIYYDLVIAQILVENGSTAISENDITDTRGNELICGWSGALLSNEFSLSEKASKAELADIAKNYATKLELSSGSLKTSTNKIHEKNIINSTPSVGSFLKFNGTDWKADFHTFSTITSSLNSSATSYSNFVHTPVNFTAKNAFKSVLYFATYRLSNVETSSIGSFSLDENGEANYLFTVLSPNTNIIGRIEFLLID